MESLIKLPAEFLESVAGIGGFIEYAAGDLFVLRGQRKFVLHETIHGLLFVRRDLSVGGGQPAQHGEGCHKKGHLVFFFRRQKGLPAASFVQPTVFADIKSMSENRAGHRPDGTAQGKADGPADHFSDPAHALLLFSGETEASLLVRKSFNISLGTTRISSVKVVCPILASPFSSMVFMPFSMARFFNSRLGISRFRALAISGVTINSSEMRVLP